MPPINIPTNDHAALVLTGGNETVYVKKLSYTTPQDAQAAADAYHADNGATFDLPMPDGQQRPLTRGEILFLKALLHDMIIMFRGITGIPIPIP